MPQIQKTDKPTAEDTEIISADQIPDGDEDDDGDEDVVPPVDEDDEPAEGDQPDGEPEGDEDEDGDADGAGDSPSGASAAPRKDGEPEDTDATEPQPEPSNTTPKSAKPVPGETPRERALREKVTELRNKLREKSVAAAVGDKPTEPEGDSDVEALKELGYSDEQIEKLEKVVDVIAARRGYAKRPSYQQTVNDVTRDFVAEHPEYAPENDPEDARWLKFDEIAKSGFYDLKGKRPDQLKAIFKRIHRDVEEELGTANLPPKPKADPSEDRKVAAARHKVEMTGKAGAGSGGAPVTKTDKRPLGIGAAERGIFKDFSDEELSSED